MVPCTLLVFARPPVPGRVKSRLALGIGEDGALEIYQAMLGTLLQRLESLPRTIAVEVWSADPALEPLAAMVRGRFPLRVQDTGDLGRRMQHALDTTLAAGSRAAIIGSDSPDLPLARITDAFTALESSDVTLGPTADGGYYLVGLRRTAPGLFEQVPWSSGRELESTRSNARRAGLSVAALAPWYDIDHLEDLEHFMTVHSAGAEPCLERLLGLARRRLAQAWTLES